ncbi:Dolichyl-diphosphooligosaccharide--protein glycosyltransferasesubunit [Trichinella spiralis]|uniref:Dolichyl-diphosphooligosaccharide--protein glycosyltransferase 48 kDa subunit n=1 Tax=Trichinella spiralis TaxID=6334 RepID=A0ABR3KZS3_TRISP
MLWITNHATTTETAGKILVLVDGMHVRETHSAYFEQLKNLGFEVTFRMADDPTLVLSKYGELLYHHIAIFAPSTIEFGGAVNVPEIVDFVDHGGNVLVAGDSRIGQAIGSLAAECGFEFGENSTAMIDHFNKDEALDNGHHTTFFVNSENVAEADIIVEKKNLAPVVYRGTGLIRHENNPLTLSIMHAPRTAYARSLEGEAGMVNRKALWRLIGNNAVLVGAVQAKNNARVVFTGSLDMFSDEFINSNYVQEGGKKIVPTGNRDFVKAISEWVFKRKGVLRVKSIRHHRSGELLPPPDYTIMDGVEYEIEVEELKNGLWVPYTVNDMQMEFVRIDPFIRMTMKSKAGKYKANFKVPDVYGVYKFLVDYSRIGWTHLRNVTQVSVRPFKHYQFERFVPSAYPYYISAFTMMLKEEQLDDERIGLNEKCFNTVSNIHTVIERPRTDAEEEGTEAVRVLWAWACHSDVVCSLHCCGSGTTGVDEDDDDELALLIVDLALGAHVASAPYAFVEGAFHLGDGEHEQLVPAETVFASAYVAVAGDAEDDFIFDHQPYRRLESHLPVQTVPLAQTSYIVDSLLPVGRVVADAQQLDQVLPKVGEPLAETPEFGVVQQMLARQAVEAGRFGKSRTSDQYFGEQPLCPEGVVADLLPSLPNCLSVVVVQLQNFAGREAFHTEHLLFTVSSPDFIMKKLFPTRHSEQFTEEGEEKKTKKILLNTSKKKIENKR